MQESLTRLVDGCVGVHCQAPTTKHAKKGFKDIVVAAYEMGIRDATNKIIAEQNQQLEPQPNLEPTQPQQEVPPPQQPTPQGQEQQALSSSDQETLLDNL